MVPTTYLNQQAASKTLQLISFTRDNHFQITFKIKGLNYRHIELFKKTKMKSFFKKPLNIRLLRYSKAHDVSH
jgi:hypothetical protein